jgi:hypothetical protein
VVDVEREIGLLLVRLAVSQGIAGNLARFKAGQIDRDDYLVLA